MAGPDFRNLLSKPADDVTRPRPIAAGTYYGRLKSREFGESPDKKTPYVRFHINGIRAGEDIDLALLVDEKGKQVDLAKKEFRADYYITPDSEYRLVDMLVSLGIRKDGRSIGEMIEDAVGKDVMLDVNITPNKNDPDHPGYNNVNKIGPIS